MKDAEIDDTNNNSEEEEKVIVGTEFIEQKADPENDENAIDFRWLDIQGEDEEDIAKANLIENLQKQAVKKFFLKE